MSYVLDALDQLTEVAPAGADKHAYLNRVVQQNKSDPYMRKVKRAVKNAAIMGLVMSNFPKVSGTAAAMSVRKILP
jgi:hypothetical protein